MDTPEPGIPSLALDPAVLTRVVCAALGSDTAAIERWQVRSATSSRGSATAGVYHISGTADDRGAPAEWAIMLKILRPAAAAWNPAAREIDHPLYWKRELLAYEFRLLADLPSGISAPRCLAIEEHADESGWPVAQYAHAAGALGRFNGAYLAGQPLPTHPWLGPPGAMRGLLQAFAFVQDVVRDPATWQHSLLRAAFPIPIAERILRIWADRASLLDALERLPQTLCHKDAFRRNMFAAADVHGQPIATFVHHQAELGAHLLDLADEAHHLLRAV
jgi:hypothetical protein